MRAELGNLTLLGTAHVSKKSVQAVKDAIEETEPSVVCVELDENRLEALRDPTAWAKIPVLDLVREGQGPQLLAQVLLGSYQHRIGEQTGVEPGEELLTAVEAAEEVGAEVVLADRDVGTTLRRAFQAMGFREKMRVAWEIMKAALPGAEEQTQDLDEDAIDELLEEDALTAAMEEMAALAPSASHVLIDERDAYMATRIQETQDEHPEERVLAVLGAGHLNGVKTHIEQGNRADTDALESTESTRFPWGKAIAWLLAAGILSVFGLLTYQAITTGDFATLQLGLLWYFLLSGVFAAAGSLIAGGGLLTTITAFLASPLTSLNPAVAAGWFAGAVEAWRREPRVGDIENLREIYTFSDMRSNRLVRVLLVAALVNVGSIIGSWTGFAKLFDVADIVGVILP